MIWAKVSTRFESLHRWESIPSDHPKQFLKHDHRHEFHVAVWVEQDHANRAVEYLVLKDQLNGYLKDYKMGPMSCEMLAQEIINYVKALYPGLKVCCEVLEDGENGAFVDETLAIPH